MQNLQFSRDFSPPKECQLRCGRPESLSLLQTELQSDGPTSQLVKQDKELTANVQDRQKFRQPDSQPQLEMATGEQPNAPLANLPKKEQTTMPRTTLTAKPTWVLVS
jgi:hypothetical protein